MLLGQIAGTLEFIRVSLLTVLDIPNVNDSAVLTEPWWGLKRGQKLLKILFHRLVPGILDTELEMIRIGSEEIMEIVSIFQP